MFQNIKIAIFLQICGMTGDGVYFHTKVPEKLELALKKKVFTNYDPAHKVALVDVELRSGKRKWSVNFKWLIEQTIVVGKGVALVAWGKVWSLFVEICLELQEDPDCVFTKMLRPTRFNEIKFAHHAHEVYEKCRHNFNPMVRLLETLKEAGLGGSADQKKKAQDADEIQGKILNWMFCLSLSMIIDVYKVSGQVSCCVQKIDVLPHEKFDSFQQLLDTYKSMASRVSVESCPCNQLNLDEEGWQKLLQEDSKICAWPTFHRDVSTALKLGTYQGVNLGMVRPEERHTRRGADVNNEWLQVDIGEVVNRVEKRAVELVNFVEEMMKEKVYSKSDIEAVQHTRTLLDIRVIAEKARDQGVVTASGLLHFRPFQKAALFFEPNLEDRLDQEDFRLQWGVFNQVIVQLLW